MKIKGILTFCLCLSLSFIFAQDQSVNGKLTVKDILLDNGYNNVMSTTGDNYIGMSNNTTTLASRAFFEMWGNHATRAGEFTMGGTYLKFFANVQTDGFGFEAMRLLSNGNLGIGTATPQSKLAVKGKIESQEVQVKTNVADYVFEEDYKVISLEELESYIKVNGHLPNIQTQKDVDNNRGLVNVGELSISLMEKLEELTIHMIDMNKRVKLLEKENIALKNKLQK